jgi:hypothetical protein
MIDMSNSTNIDVRFVALEDGGVAPCRLHKLLCSPVAQCALNRTAALGGAQGARGAEEGASEGHDGQTITTRQTEREEKRW